MANTYHSELSYTARRVDNGIDINDRIDNFVENYIVFYKNPDFRSTIWFDGTEERLLKQALKEAAKTPSGRIAIYSMIHFAQKTKKKINIHVSDKPNGTGLTGITSTETGNIILYPKELEDLIHTTQKELKNKLPKSYTSDKMRQTIFFDLGCTVLHEVGHYHQIVNGKGALPYNTPITTYEAYPQALTRLMYVESRDPLLHLVNNISKTENQENMRAIQYDPRTHTFNEELATKHCPIFLQKYAKDWVASLTQKPAQNYSDLYKRWCYISRQYLGNLINGTPELTRNEKQGLREYIKDEIHLNTPINQGMPQPLKKLFDKKYASLKNAVQNKTKNHTTTQAILLNYLQNMHLDDTTFKKMFKGQPGFQEAFEFKKTLDDINSTLKNLSILSSKVQDGDKEAQKKAEKERQKFKQKYGVNLPAYNQQGDKIAQNEEPDCITRLRLAQTNQPKTQTMHKDNSRQV